MDQSALGLNLCVYNGIPDLKGSAVRLFEEKRVEVSPGINVHLGIIGASHIFSFSMGSFRMMEMLACTEPPAFEGFMLKAPLGLLAPEGVENEMPPLLIPFPGVHYAFNGTISKADEEAIAGVVQLKNRARAFAAEARNVIFLEHDFGSHGDGVTAHAFPPETLVQFTWLAEGKALLHTVHTYPNEGKLVKTFSLLSISKFGERSARAGHHSPDAYARR